ncbi:MFS transporter [SAR202 cluster bacterium AC-647-N09_OGT_505m]|nr:MFS transporter [SAR202 cluster bacterium AC-647-N09_OGT_505m]
MNRVFYGWWIVLACWAVTLYGGGAFFFGFSAFFKPISEEFGWSRAITAGAISLSQAEGFIEGPIVGPLVDRFGPRKLMLLGVCMVTVGFLALSMVNTLVFFYLVYVVFLAIGFNTGFFVAAQAAVANWFIKRRSRALGLLSTANGFGGAIMAPLIAWLILSFGWRVASVWIGIGMFAIGIPLALVVRHRPEQYGYLPDGEKAQVDFHETRQSVEEAPRLVSRPGEVDFTIWEALATRVFWMLAVAFGLRTLAISATVIHQIPFLTDRGISEQAAAGILAMMGLMSIPGRLIFGFLGDYCNKRYLLAIAYLLQALGIFILLNANSIPQVILFTVVFGMGWGAPNLLFAMRADYFGRKYFATIAGVEQSIVAIGTIIGPVYAGLVYDINQNYQLAYGTFIVSITLGAVICFFAYPPKLPKRLRQPQEETQPSA